MGKLLWVSKLVVGLASIFLFVNVIQIAEQQEWSSEISLITNWGRLWQFVVMVILAVNYYRLAMRSEAQEKEILNLKREFYETRDLRANYTIQHAERLNDIEHKIGIRK